MKPSISSLLTFGCIFCIGATSTAQAQTNCTLDQVIVGGFDVSRSSQASFTVGTNFSGARSALLTNYPATLLTSFPQLVETNLVGVDVLVLGVGTNSFDYVTPLSASEQAALTNYVRRGGAAVLFIDNDSSAPEAAQVDASFIAPFGMAAGGTVPGVVVAVVTNPSADPVTSGPFGVIPSFIEYVAGAITNLGPYATSVATNAGGCALAVIPPGAMAPGSGPVVVFSDMSGFWDVDGFFPSNTAVFLNAMAYTRRNPQHQLLRIDPAGTNVVLHWPVADGDVVLETNSGLGTSTKWVPLGQTSVTNGGEQFVTNSGPRADFFRLRCGN